MERGRANRVENVGDAVEVVNAIHRGLVDKWREVNGVDAPEADPAEVVDTSAAPAWTRVANLTIFSHGEPWGLALNEDGNSFTQKGLRSEDRSRGGKTYEDNVQAFADAMQGSLAGDVRVQLFACSAGRDSGTDEDYDHWQGHDEGMRDGETSFASALRGALGHESSVYAHRTAGHTTENFAALVFGHDAEGAGGTSDQGGAHIFELIYTSAFIQSELERLFRDLDDEQRGARRDSLRELMWTHFVDSVDGEHNRSRKRYDQPMGMDSFADIDHARTHLQADFQTWVASRTSQIRAGR